MRKQRGSTFLGFILGALFGLGVALAVAIYVTKVPIPFMSKTLPRNPDGDAAEARKNRDWNPNAGLSNKPAARPPEIVPPAPPSPAEPRAALPAPTPVTPTRPGVTTDPLGDLAKARTGSDTAVVTPAKPPPPGASQGIDPFSYFIQVGAFRTPEDAEQQRARISLMGLQARVSEREQSGRTVYRVRLGPFERKDDADKAKEKLDASGIETALVRVQR